MVPGDVILGNIANHPGHVGIYLGKWDRLPERLRREYGRVYEHTLSRSGFRGLKRSFLAVDNDGGRGVRLVSFAEQFTGYLPKLRKPQLRGTLHWEAKTGGALAWPDLAIDDPRRWTILEESLKAAAAREVNATPWRLEAGARVSAGNHHRKGFLGGGPRFLISGSEENLAINSRFCASLSIIQGLTHLGEQNPILRPWYNATGASG